MTDSCGTVFPRRVEEAAKPIGGSGHIGVVIGLVTQVELCTVISSVDASSNASLRKGIARLQQDLILAVGCSDAVPNVFWAARYVEFRNGFGKVVPINAVNHTDRRLVVVPVRVHGVDKKMTVVINMHACDFGFGR